MEQALIVGLQVAGISQLLLCVGSLAIPRSLQWSERTADLEPLIRQMFYTYAFYIWGAHLFFGVVSLGLASELCKGAALGNALLVLMMAWWMGRLCCQFCYFDRTGIPENRFNKLAEGILVTMFVSLVGVYGGALIWNLMP